MNSVVSSNSTVATDVVIPLERDVDGDSQQCVFGFQPVDTAFWPAARAVACGLIYRFTRVNTGHGSLRIDRDKMSPDVCSVQAWTDHDTPAQGVQLLLAEWLLVWAALKIRFPTNDTNFRVVHRPEEDALFTDVRLVNSPQELLEDIRSLESEFVQGQVLVSPAAMLAFCASWFGRAHVLFKDAVVKDEQEKQTTKRSLTIMLPSQSKAESPLYTLFTWAASDLAKNNTAFFGALETVFHHSVALQTVKVHRDCGGYMETLAKVAAKLPGVALSRDALLYSSASGDGSAAASVYMPAKATVTTSQYETMLTFNAVTVAIKAETKTAVGVVLPITGGDAPLQAFMLQCAAAKSLKQLGSTKRSRTDADLVARQIWRLFPGVDKSSVISAVNTAVRQLFGGTGDSDASVVSAQTTTSIVRDAASTLSATKVTDAERPVFPGRLFSTGNVNVTLTYTKEQLNAEKCAAALQCLNEFATSTVAVRDADTKRTFVRDAKQELLCEFLRKNADDSQIYMFSPKPGSDELKAGLQPVSKKPLWGVAFTYTQLLWLAMDSNPRVHQIFRQLHEDLAVYGTDVDAATEVPDDKKQKIAHDILNRDLSHCSTWLPNLHSTFTMWFPHDSAEAFKSVLALEVIMMPRVVAELVDDGVVGEGTTFIIGETDATTNDIVLTNLLRPRVKTPGLVKKSAYNVVIRKDFVKESSGRGLLRRVLFTTTHIMVMQLFSTRAEVQALQTLLEFCQPDSFSKYCALREDTENNKQELQQRLEKYRLLLSDDARSMVSVDSAATLTA